jgi:hypothetical protein
MNHFLTILGCILVTILLLRVDNCVVVLKLFVSGVDINQ